LKYINDRIDELIIEKENRYFAI